MTESDEILAEALERLLKACHPFSSRRDGVAQDKGLSPELWSAFAEMGLLGASIPTEYGGGGDASLLYTIMRAFGGHLVVQPYLPCVILSVALLRRAASAEQKRLWLQRIAAGDLLCALAFSEPRSRYNLANIALSAESQGCGWRLNGCKSVVLGGPAADAFIVSARTNGGRWDRTGVSLFWIESDASGLHRRDYVTADGMHASELVLEDVEIGADALVGPPGEGLPHLEAALDEGLAAIGAEAVGAMEAVIDRCVEHCRNRVVFGRPLAAHQVVQHQLVDLKVAVTHADAMVRRVFAELDSSPERLSAAASAMKVQLAKEADLVAKTAVQLHGAMGMADETDVSHYFRRLTLMATQFGDADHHLRRFIDLDVGSPASAAEALDDVTNLGGLSTQDEAFRATIRAFYQENLSEDLRRAADLTLWHMTEFPYGADWQKVLHRHGYGAVEWPVEYGGKDWTPTQRMIWNAETARARPPLVMSMGKIYCGPCIMKFGTPEQKDYFLPRIISGEDWWAQGYSEPGAGSDLAMLQLSAISDGDDYVLNGSKIWTTFAHNANRIFCLVRTSQGERKQQGITFLLVDMDTPGIEVRPILNMAGDHDFNQVFFTDVRVPKDRRLGEEDQGWTVARHLLLYEHGANLARNNMENIRRLGWLREIAACEDDGFGGSLLAQPDFARRVAEAEIETQAMDFAARGILARVSKGEPPGSQHELLSIRSRLVGQRLSELAKDAVAYYAAPHQPEARRMSANADPVGPQHALLAMPFYLTQRGLTIAGGAPEVHKNNLAKHLLQL